MKTWLSLPTRLLKKPYDRVFPLILLAVVLGLTCASVRMLVVMPRPDEVSRLQARLVLTWGVSRERFGERAVKRERAAW